MRKVLVKNFDGEFVEGTLEKDEVFWGGWKVSYENSIQSIKISTIKEIMKKIYLAIPYSGLEETSFKLANQVTGAVMNKGNIPMSPISHSHPIAMECEVPGDWEFWKAMDFSFIDWADELLVINIDDELVKNSIGVQAEIEYAIKTGKPVKYLEVTPEGEWYKFEV